MAAKNSQINVVESENKEDFIYDQITGARGKKGALSLLNKKCVGKHEMDELFCDWG